MDLPLDINVLCIQNYGRSGSTFLNSLFDGHQNLVTLPGIYNAGLLFIIMEFEPLYEKTNNIHLILRRFVSRHQHWFEPTIEALTEFNLNRMGEDRNQIICIHEDIFKKKFIDVFMGLQEQSFRKRFFVAVNLAYHLSLGKQLNNRTLIVFHAHCQSVSNMSFINEEFPNAFFLYLLREPIKNLESHIYFALYRQHRTNAFELAIAALANDFNMFNQTYCSTPYFETKRKFTKAIRLEDIHLDPRNTLQSISGWLQIPWNDKLLESTFNGLKWWNFPESMQASGFNPKIIEVNDSRYFSKFDIFRLYCLFYTRNRSWRYYWPGYSSFIMVRLLLLIILLVPFSKERYFRKFKLAATEQKDNLRLRLREYWAVRRQIYSSFFRFTFKKREKFVQLLHHFDYEQYPIVTNNEKLKSLEKSFDNHSLREKRNQAQLDSYRLGFSTLNEWMNQQVFIHKWKFSLANNTVLTTNDYSFKIILVYGSQLSYESIYKPVLESFGVVAKFVNALLGPKTLLESVKHITNTQRDPFILIESARDYQESKIVLKASGLEEFRDFITINFTSSKKSLKDQLIRAKLNYKKIIVFGSGGAYVKHVEQLLKELDIVPDYAVDNDENKKNQVINGLHIRPVSDLYEEDRDKLFIIVSSSYYDAIMEQLEKMGFEEEQHFVRGV